MVYNIALEQRRDWWRQYERNVGRRLNYPAQAQELTKLRAEFDWIAAVSQTCQQQALRDLDKAFSNFFAGRSRFPTVRRKGANDAFRFQGREVETKRLNGKWSAVRLPKIGWVKFRDTRPVLGDVRNVTVASDASGWHVSFACASEQVSPQEGLPSVGIDRGVANTIALSTGEFFSLPKTLEVIDRRRRRAQRALARKLRGSKRRAKAARVVASLSSRMARIRQDWAHRTTFNIAARFGVVVLEDLNIKSMTTSARGTHDAPGRNVRQKAGLNRSILAQGWGSFESTLAYKLEAWGGTLVKVDPAYTSQACSECGAIDSESRESQARFSCRHCGHSSHADHNAAINILRRNTASMRMEEGHWLSDEVRTGGGRKSPENPLASAMEDVNPSPHRAFLACSS